MFYSSFRRVADEEPPEQAAAVMKAMSLETPSKRVKKSPALLLEEEEAEEVPEVDELEDLRTRFVGDIEVTEGIPVLFIVLVLSPDRSLKTKSHCLLSRSDDLSCSLFNTPRHVSTRLLSRLI
jgi:hypothetical protein